MKIILASGAVAAMVAVTVISSGFRNRTVEDKRIPVKLNEVLTNELSDTSSLTGLDRRMEVYMQEWNLRGVSLAVMRNDSLMYAKGYGWADKEKKTAMTPGTLLRLASVSKLITATGIMVLKEQGKLTLSDTVFGENGILNDTSYTRAIYDRNCFRITVEHLLRHQGGFTSRAGDPMFSTLTLIQQNHLSEPPDNETLIKIVLRRKLGFVPGTSQYYSNFGYLLLSKVIEKVSGQPYEDFIRENVLHPAHCDNFHIANNYYKDRYKGESKYYVQSNDPPVQEYNNSGQYVTRCYGGNDIHNLSGAGAWIASVPELIRFVASIDGKPWVSDIISVESVNEMTEWFDSDTYSLGWNDTKPDGEWTRTGTFSGTSALIKCYPDGECWIMVTNTSTWKGPGFTRYTSGLFSSLREKYSPLLPQRDFFFENGD